MPLHPHDNSDSDTDSFHSFSEDTNVPQRARGSSLREGAVGSSTHSPSQAEDQAPEATRFSPEEEARLLATSNDLKKTANSFFASGSFSDAISSYDAALAECPAYFDYETAVLRANIAACQLKLSAWKEAMDSATKGLDSLKAMDPLPEISPPERSAEAVRRVGTTSKSSGSIEEVTDEDEKAMERLKASGHTLEEVRRLRVKTLMRRARARRELGGWANLQGAEEDYSLLMTRHLQDHLVGLDKQTVRQNLNEVKAASSAAREKETAEMMSKLKDLGNGMLKPFGLSTDMFQFVKDEKSGGYSMNFNQGERK